MQTDSSGSGGRRRRRNTGISYKFQRLREKIRQAVASGELSGKLPGERELARRFHVNAKTLSKALTDLAAEGLLHRSVGRGTFVKGAESQDRPGEGAWLLLVDQETDQHLVDNLRAIHPRVEVCQDISAVRPSFLNQFTAVVDLAIATPRGFFRDLLVRGVRVVIVGWEQRKYSTDAVALDVMLGIAHLTRDLVLGGHRHFLAIENHKNIMVADGIRQWATRYCSDCSVDACSPSEVVYAVECGATACICDSAASAMQTMGHLQRAGIEVPRGISVAAVGRAANDFPCTGYFVDPKQSAAAVAEILMGRQSGRPTVLWLTGALIDRGTTAPKSVGIAGPALSAAERSGPSAPA